MHSLGFRLGRGATYNGCVYIVCVYYPKQSFPGEMEFLGCSWFSCVVSEKDTISNRNDLRPGVFIILGFGFVLSLLGGFCRRDPSFSEGEYKSGLKVWRSVCWGSVEIVVSIIWSIENIGSRPKTRKNGVSLVVSWTEVL